MLTDADRHELLTTSMINGATARALDHIDTVERALVAATEAKLAADTHRTEVIRDMTATAAEATVARDRLADALAELIHSLDLRSRTERDAARAKARAILLEEQAKAGRQ